MTSMRGSFPRKALFFALLTVPLLHAAASSNARSLQQRKGTTPSPPPAPAPTWDLLWSDNFTGTALDSSKWEYQLGKGCQYGICGWGNNELEWYTDLTSNTYGNVKVANDMLTITARKPTGSDLTNVKASCASWCATMKAAFNYDETACSNDCNAIQFTSARIRTAGKYAVQPDASYTVDGVTRDYGTIKIEFSIQIQTGSGMWPAVWMLPEGGATTCSGCGAYGGWAASGELDLLEAKNDGKTSGFTLHYGGPWPKNTFTALSSDVTTQINNNAFIKYTLLWSTTKMEWYIDDVLKHTQYSKSVKRTGWFSTATNKGPNSPFDEPFHFILNLAVGGTYTGITDPNVLATTLSTAKTMNVDYVRVYGARKV